MPLQLRAPALAAGGHQDDPLNGYRGIEGPKEQVDRIRKAYRLYGQEGNLVHVTPEGGHQWYGECYEFLDRML